MQCGVAAEILKAFLAKALLDFRVRQKFSGIAQGIPNGRTQKTPLKSICQREVRSHA
jgi:hypothetical protein